MANYFSNHSSSRFLANSAQTTTTTTSTAQPGAAAAVTSQPSPSPSNASRSRIPSSKHFSTTVITTQPAASKDPASTSTPSSATSAQVHPLRNTWVFWFRQQRAPGNKIISYEEGIKKIAAFSSVESFWSLWTHLAPPSSLQPTTDYLLFHAGIRRPVWEDPLNLQGGKWIIRLKKGVADRFWEDLVMAVIGDQFDDCRGKVDDNSRAKSATPATPKSEEGSESSTTEWPEICGCTISVRQSEDIVTVWNRVDGDPKLREQIRDTLRKVLNLPASTIMEYKSNNGKRWNEDHRYNFVSRQPGKLTEARRTALANATKRSSLAEQTIKAKEPDLLKKREELKEIQKMIELNRRYNQVMKELLTALQKLDETKKKLEVANERANRVDDKINSLHEEADAFELKYQRTKKEYNSFVAEMDSLEIN